MQDLTLIPQALRAACLGGVERGERNPSFTNLTRIASALGVRLSAVIALGEQLASG